MASLLIALSFAIKLYTQPNNVLKVETLKVCMTPSHQKSEHLGATSSDATMGAHVAREVSAAHTIDGSTRWKPRPLLQASPLKAKTPAVPRIGPHLVSDAGT